MMPILIVGLILFVMYNGYGNVIVNADDGEGLVYHDNREIVFVCLIFATLLYIQHTHTKGSMISSGKSNNKLGKNFLNATNWR